MMTLTKGIHRQEGKLTLTGRDSMKATVTP